MRTAGIIAEYNPFHSGHAWQIAQLRRQGFDAMVCVCSPGVVQRGMPALLPTRVRAAAALAGGADLVLCLPAPCALRSSEGFAAAGVAALSALGCVQTLCFGVPEGETEDYTRAAALLERAAFAPLVREALDAGLPLPAARAAAAERLCPGTGALLHEGNALLAVDYCRAILRQNSALLPLALRRQGAAHDAPLAAGCGAVPEGPGGLEQRGDAPPEAAGGLEKRGNVPPEGPGGLEQRGNVPQEETGHSGNGCAPQNESAPHAFASASALRALAGRRGASALAPYVPAACLAVYRQAEQAGAWLDEAAFGTAALSRLRALDADALGKVRGASEGLEHRLAAAVRRADTWEALIDAMKTKRYPTARLRRFALDAALGYTAALPMLPPYLHVLGANETGRRVLRAAKHTARLPLSHALARLAETGAAAAQTAAAHAAAEDLTALCLRRPDPMGTAYTTKALFVP